MKLYDFFGDVHGKFWALKRLLTKLGYTEHNGVWSHPARIAVFVGDLLDRGPDQVATIMLVRRMAEAGAALVIMGNHEHNAIGWLRTDPKTGLPRRAHSASNRHHHEAFLREVEQDPVLHKDIVDWLSTLPVALELGCIRVAHACWDDREMGFLRNPAGTFELSAEQLTLSFIKGTVQHHALDVVARGPELELPPGLEYTDLAGTIRTHVRAAWWRDRGALLSEVALPMVPLKPETLPPLPVDESVFPAQEDEKLYVFGHYWLKGTPEPLSATCLCLDYTGEPGQPLTAYRWSGEAQFDAKNFVQSL